MYDHIGLNVKDFGASMRFYEAVLGALGHVLCSNADGCAGFGPAGEAAFWLYDAPDAPAGRTHVTFRAPSRTAVGNFHAAGLEAGARDNGKPGTRPDYSPTYYAAFLIDPDGNNVEAVCFN